MIFLGFTELKGKHTMDSAKHATEHVYSMWLPMLKNSKLPIEKRRSNMHRANAI